MNKFRLSEKLEHLLSKYAAIVCFKIESQNSHDLQLIEDIRPCHPLRRL